MRATAILLFCLVAFVGNSFGEEPAEPKTPDDPCEKFETMAGVDMRDPGVLNEYMKCMVKHIAWPEGMTLSSVGIEAEHGANYAFCVVNVEKVLQCSCDEMVLKAAALFGGALADSGHISRLCLTLKHGEERARVFIPLDLARQIGTELQDSVTISIASKRDLIMRCDWGDLDRMIATQAKKQTSPDTEPQAINVAYVPEALKKDPPEPEAPAARPTLVRYILKSGASLYAAEAIEAGDFVALTDDSGRFHRLKKSDIERTVRP
jgi:hypothetical protein